MLTLDRLNELLAYDAATGEFRWKVARSNLRAGSTAGTLDSQGYRQIKIDGVLYLAHRLAWRMVTGEMPPPFLDHRDNDPANIRFNNLRPASRKQNAANRLPNKNTAVGLKGVRTIKGCKTFRAVIGDGPDRTHLGTFKTAEEAHEAYCREAARRYGEFARFGHPAQRLDEQKLLPPPVTGD